MVLVLSALECRRGGCWRSLQCLSSRHGGTPPCSSGRPRRIVHPLSSSADSQGSMTAGRSSPRCPAEVNLNGSLFAEDLDLFRRGGLFDLLEHCENVCGRRCARFVAAGARGARCDSGAPGGDCGAARNDGAARAACKLRRGGLWTPGCCSVGSVGIGVEPKIPAGWRWICPLLVVLTVGDSGAVSRHKSWVVAACNRCIIDATITFALLKRTQALFVSAERASDSLKLASVLIERWEQQKFISPLLHELQQALHGKEQNASHALARLALLARMMEQRGNLMVRVFDAPLLYSVQLAGRRTGLEAKIWSVA